jgi:hypothetical protein
MFDTVGTVVVALFGTSRFESLVDRVTGWLDRGGAGGQ